jgi:hypothetical protein
MTSPIPEGRSSKRLTRRPVSSMLDSGNEDDLLDALADTLSLNGEDEWDWGAEHSEDDR